MDEKSLRLISDVAYIRMVTKITVLRIIIIFRKISLKFTGNPLVDWMTNLFTSVITTVLHNVIISIAESVLRGNVEAAIDQINDYIQNNYPPTYPSV